MITRRFFAVGAAAAIVAPAIVKFEALMPVRSMIVRQSGFTAAELHVDVGAVTEFYLRLRNDPLAWISMVQSQTQINAIARG